LSGPNVDDVYRYGPASIEISGGGRLWHSTVRFRNQEKDFEAHSRAGALEKATDWVDSAPELARLLENQGSAAPFVIGAIAVGGLLWWLLRSKPASAEPAPVLCPITEAMLTAYVKTKPTDYKLYLPPERTQPVATWPPPKPDYLTQQNVHTFSIVDCGFYKWDGKKWVSDDAENQALAKYIGATTVKGVPRLNGHPADLFMLPL
jgi:hypothetical protein